MYICISVFFYWCPNGAYVKQNACDVKVARPRSVVDPRLQRPPALAPISSKETKT